MSATVSTPASDKNLIRVLNIDAVLSVVGAIAGALSVNRLGGWPHMLAGAWVGILAANIAVWGVVLIVGAIELLTNHKTVALDAPAIAGTEFANPSVPQSALNTAPAPEAVPALAATATQPKPAVQERELELVA